MLEPVLPQGRLHVPRFEAPHILDFGQVSRFTILQYKDPFLGISMYHHLTSQQSSLYMEQRLSRHFYNNLVCLFSGVGVNVCSFMAKWSQGAELALYMG